MSREPDFLYYVEYVTADTNCRNAYYSYEFNVIRAYYLTMIEQRTYRSIKLVKLVTATDEQIIIMSK